ncbi:PREDICTED: uncharacterized protein LOC104826746 isoform X2 [Tarenaya hassleriana]|uniref:uncharacterized protein LOC104826746 isoform X2 n=1 Tax=Tarenaya hassleriana TaxID=28532 RepID=UPI00053C2ADE|nr:PREDICTED: uncharacterized protein LOC104826746 isoform X2 [Tarenaya hassleriana]
MASMRTDTNLSPASCSKGNCCALWSGELAKTDVDDAVELSVAASEALVIHELVKSDQLEAVYILEAALRMSKSRLESVCCTMDYLEEVVDQSDSFSDFDDSVMLEAFQDVGLSSSIHDGEPQCHVSVCEGRNCLQSESCDDTGGNGQDSDDNFVQDDNGKFSSGKMSTCSEGVKDPALYEASEEISEFTPPNKDNADRLVGQGVMSKPLVRETSLLSESEDIPIDKCSLVEKHGACCGLASQSSVHFDRFCERADEVDSSIHDEGSYNLSPIDQLCSVVPCSIPQENGVPFLALGQNTIGIPETCFGSIENHNKEHLPRFSGAEIRSYKLHGQAVASFLNGYAQSSTQMNSAWMKNYIRPALKGRAVTHAEPENLPSLLPKQPMLVHHTAAGENENQKNHNEKPELLVGKENLDAYHPKRLQNVQSECEDLCDMQAPARKRVRFSEFEVKQHQEKVSQEQQGFTASRSKRTKYSIAYVLEKHLSSPGKYHRRSVFQGLEFLLTGFPNGKQKKIEQLIHKHGGIVLQDIPSHSSSKQRRHSKASFRLLPVILCLKKLQTTKFLYGCAVKTLILQPKWVTDSISAGSILPFVKYMILPNQSKIRCTRSGKPVHFVESNLIFDGVGFMLCGKCRFCTQLTIIIKSLTELATLISNISP